MSVTVIVIDALAAAGLGVSLARDRGKTLAALQVALRAALRLGPVVLLVVLLIGLLFAFLPPERLSALLGERSGVAGVLLAAALGAVLHIPALISFPLAGSLREMGASVTTVAAFITTLTMIGIVTLPVEIRELGRTRALLRNGLSLAGALAIAAIMGLIL